MKGQSIKVSIANRVYPLTVSADEEESIRMASKLINSRIKEFEQAYSVQDTQDLLAMSALQFGVEKLEIERKGSKFDATTEQKIEKLIELVDESLNVL